MHYFEEADTKHFQPKSNSKLRSYFGFVFIIALIQFEKVYPLLKQKIKFCSDKIDQLLF